jgi:4'-phosphopantetheinyl transferase
LISAIVAVKARQISLPKLVLKKPIGVTRILSLTREARNLDVILGVAAEHDYAQIVTEAHHFLGPRESEYFGRLRFLRRQKSYLLGRYAAKLALQQALDEPDLKALEIVPGAFGQPLIAYPSKRTSGICISHCHGFAVGLTFPLGHPMGIDIEQIDPEREATIRTQLLEPELKWVESGIVEGSALTTLIWTVKEALSKALTTGLMCPIEIYELSELNLVGQGIWEGLFTKFGQYRFVGWLADGYALSIVLPKYTQFLGGRPDFTGLFSGAEVS